MAIYKSPGWMLRLSIETPVADHVPEAVPPVALAASDEVHNVLEGAVNVLVMSGC